MRVVSAGLGSGYVRIADSITYQKDAPRAKELDVRTFNKVFNRTIEEIMEEQAKLSKKDNDRYLLLDKQILMISDPTLLKRMEALRKSEKLSPLKAYMIASNEFVLKMSRSEDEMVLRQKADFEEVLERLFTNMFNESSSLIDIDEPIILVCETLTFQQIARVNRKYLKGIILRHVSAHTPIKIASAMGIPVVECDDIEQYNDGDCLQVYANHIALNVNHVDPSKLDDERQNSHLALETWRYSNPIIQLLGMKGIDRGIDNNYLNVYATIDSFEDLEEVLSVGADRVGLYRTELYYAKQELIPTEAMLYEEYKAVFYPLDDPLIRTFDFGRDKTVDYLEDIKDDNQGLKYALSDKFLFKMQLRAILRAASNKKYVKITFPFVTSLDDFIKANRVVELVKNQLAKEGVPYQETVFKGIMVENLEMVMDLDNCLEHVDFFTIGTTDLLKSYKEYSHDKIYDMLGMVGISMNGLSKEELKYVHPNYQEIFGVTENHGYPSDTQEIDFLFLHLIITIVDKVKAANKSISVCGDMADNPFYTMFFMWLDVDYITVAPNLVETTSRTAKLMSRYNYTDYYNMIFNKS